MRISLRWLVLPMLLLGGLGLLAPTPIGAAGPPDGFRIRDQGKFFSKEALDKAEAVITTIKKDYKQDLLIETFAAIPEELKGKYDEKAKSAFFENWARQRYNREGVSGISLLLCRQPQYLFVEMGKDTEKRAFTPANRKELVTVITSRFKQQEFDQGLLAGVNFVRETLDKSVGKAAKGATSGPLTKVTRTDTTKPAKAEENPIAAMGPLGWVCIGVAVLMVLWVVVGLFRALTGGGQQQMAPPAGYQGGPYAGGGPPGNFGPGGPPPGYIPPPGYGGYGQQPAAGGGFMRSMLGGMLGGAAGMWAYDTFLRGSGPSMTPPAYGGGTSPTYGEPDNSAGTGGGGGDWGSSPADTGGGGGDWGSPPADTGGGDWGGGGGDDAGGGDWGGGGDDSGGGDW